VIGRVSAADRNAADADGFGRPDGGVGESGAGVAGGQAVASHAIVRQGDGGGSGAVINLVDPRGADHQRSGSNISGSAGRSIGRVVARISAAEADAADSHASRGADVLAGEAGSGVGGR